MGLSLAGSARVVEVRFVGGIIDTDRINTELIHRRRLGYKDYMSRIHVLLDSRDAPHDDVAPTGASLRKIDSMPAPGDFG